MNHHPPIDPPITQLAKDDPICDLIKGIDMQVAEQIIKTSYKANEEARAIDDTIEHEMRLLSAISTSYVYGTMYVMIELFKDLGHSEEAATRKAADYIQMGAEMMAKHVIAGTDH